MHSFHRKRSTLNPLLAWSASIFIAVTNASASAIPFQIESPDNGLAFHDSQGADAGQNSQRFFNDSMPVESTEELFAAQPLSRAAIGLNVSSPNDLRLSDYQNRTISSALGSTVTLNLQNFTLTDHSTLTLSGDATSTFVINVTDQFSLTKNAKIVLTGGLQWNHVLFNVLGSGPTVSLGRHAILVGTLTSNQRKVRLNGHAIVYGAVLSQQVVIRQAAQVLPLPIVSQ